MGKNYAGGRNTSRPPTRTSEDPKKQLTFQALGGCTFASSYQIVVANAKSEPATVQVVEPIPGDWQITSENLPHAKSSSSTATWSVRVPADGKATLTYSARVKLCF
jgi:hypothetical protein